MPATSFYVIAYDVPDDGTRNRLVKVLEDYGDRVQYSVFEAAPLSRQLFDDMLGRIREVIDPGEDRVRIYRLCAACQEKVLIIGEGEKVGQEEVFII